MNLKEEQMTLEVKKEMRGGKGEVSLCHILTEDLLLGHGRMFAKITVNPGDSIGYHEHHGETEIFYFLSGTGILSDNGTSVAVGPGQCAICPDGHGHALENTGECPIVLMALILHQP